MTIIELGHQVKASIKLLYKISKIAGIDTSDISDSDARILCVALAVARNRDIQRMIIGRYSQKGKEALIRAARLSDRIEIWLYSRMEGILQAGKRIRLNAVLHEVSKYFQCDITVPLRHKAKKVRQLLYNRRKYNNRKLSDVLEL